MAHSVLIPAIVLLSYFHLWPASTFRPGRTTFFPTAGAAVAETGRISQSPAGDAARYGQTNC